MKRRSLGTKRKKEKKMFDPNAIGKQLNSLFKTLVIAALLLGGAGFCIGYAVGQSSVEECPKGIGNSVK